VDVPAPDHTDEVGKPPGGTTAGDRASGGRGGRSFLAVVLPRSWPEAVAYATGARLFNEGNDAVWAHIRAGQSLHEDLTPDELAATVTLGEVIWERWFSLGWSRTAELEGG
jgi:hypothetical protein